MFVKLRLLSETWKAATASHWLCETHDSVKQHSVLFLKKKVFLQVQLSACLPWLSITKRLLLKPPFHFHVVLQTLSLWFFFFLDEPALLTKSAFFLENKSWNGIRYNYTEKENTTDCGLLCLRVRQFKLIKLQQAEMGKANVVKEWTKNHICPNLNISNPQSLGVIKTERFTLHLV